MEEKKAKWYDNKWAVHVLLVLFFPVGIYALWKSNTIAKWWKIGGTVLIALIVISNIAGKDNAVSSSDKVDDQVVASVVLTEAQKDSIAQVQRAALITDREERTWSAREVVALYEQNEIQADIDFKDKWFYVTGKVGAIKKDIMGDMYLTLKSGELFREVQCYFDSEDEKVLAGLQKNQYVTIKGTCDGLMMNVQMKGCVLVPNKEDL